MSVSWQEHADQPLATDRTAAPSPSIGHGGSVAEGEDIRRRPDEEPPDGPLPEASAISPEPVESVTPTNTPSGLPDSPSTAGEKDGRGAP